MSAVHSNLWDNVKELVLEQYKSSPKLKGLIQSVVDECAQPLEDGAFMLQNFFNIQEATGSWLDLLGKLVGLERKAGEFDGSYRERILTEASTETAGTPDNVLFNVAMLSGDSKPQFIDEATATFFVYTGPRNYNAVKDGESFDYGEEGIAPIEDGADQVYAASVKKLAPAGVLGLVGAAIQFADGSLLGDAQGRLLLMVADDSTVERKMVLADDNNVPLFSSNGVPIRAVVKGISVPTITVNVGGQQYEAVRIKDLPDAGTENGYIPRDSDTEGTRKTNGIGASGMKALWNATEPDEE